MSAKCGISERNGFARSFDVAAAATIASSRALGSSTSVASGTTIPNTWFFSSASPFSRAEIGTNAVSDFFGSASSSLR